MTLVACALCVGTSPGAAQAPAEFRYTPEQFRCVSLHEHSRAVLEAETGLRRRRETLTRDGLWRVRGRSAPAGISVEAWYDSLALSRTSPEGVLAPDTDGLLGGRYRGTLSSAGRYTADARPFVPDEVAEVSDLGAALDDLLPPLPPSALTVGEQWRDGRGLELTRLPDSLAGGRAVRRLALRSRSEARSRHRARRYDGHRGAARDDRGGAGGLGCGDGAPAADAAHRGRDVGPGGWTVARPVAVAAGAGCRAGPCGSSWIGQRM